MQFRLVPTRSCRARLSCRLSLIFGKVEVPYCAETVPWRDNERFIVEQSLLQPEHLVPLADSIQDATYSAEANTVH